MYNKLFTKILDSSIWLENQPTRIVWITFIAMMDMDGMVALSSVGNVANRARVSIEEADEAIHCLESPDTFNPDQDHEGRRIERIPGTGWIVLNSGKYRDIVKAETARAQNRERVKRHRMHAKDTECNGDVMVGNESVMPSESESNSDQNQTLKRLIERAIEKFEKDFDPAIIESGVIESWVNKEDKTVPIKSLNYFLPQIKYLSGVAGLSSEARSSFLMSHRKRVGLELDWR